ncbi:MAG: PilN domain-containing protein [Gammaproteobacteria bacterium]|nr:PilN domain-containing protein [Gammaproteobacteria bacterium]
MKLTTNFIYSAYIPVKGISLGVGLMVLCLTVSMVGFIVAGFDARSSNQRLLTLLENKKHELANIQSNAMPALHELNQTKAVIHAVNQRSQDRLRSPTHFLKLLERSLPQQAALSSFDYDAQSAELVIKGTLATAAKLPQLIADLEKKNQFSNVQLVQQTLSATFRDVVVFEIRLQMAGGMK